MVYFLFEQEHITLLKKANWVYFNACHGAYSIDESCPYNDDDLSAEDSIRAILPHKDNAIYYHNSLLKALDIIRDTISWKKCKPFITENQFKLLKRTYFGFHFGDITTTRSKIAEHIYIDPKRPYGNSAVISDIGEILEIEKEDINQYGECYSGKQVEELNKIHLSIDEALISVIKNIDFTFGLYEKENRFDSEWKRNKQERRQEVCGFFIN